MNILKTPMRIVLVLATMFLVLPNQSFATDPAFDVFKDHTDGARKRINYDYWDLVLTQTVIDLGPSHRYAPRYRTRSTGTRISAGSTKPSWTEGNRVLFETLTEYQIAEIGDYRLGLEAIFDRVDYASFSKNEQLAYWLNLYNVTLYEQVALIYPRKNLRTAMQGSRRRPGILGAKLLVVMGVPMSLDDIMNEILIPGWQDPLVLYGLFQGSIGGPNINKSAFTGSNVQMLLERNVMDFVNSIRGVHQKNKTLLVSEFYERGAAAFPDFDVDLMAHLVEFADTKTLEIMDATTKIKADYYDWHVADLYNGVSPRDGFGNMYASVLGAGGVANMATEDIPGGLDTVTSLSLFGRDHGIKIFTAPEASLPQHTQALFRALEYKYELFGYPGTSVTIEEVESEAEDEDEK